MSDPFPVPFAGVKVKVEPGPERMEDAVRALLACGHLHNFAVELDSTAPGGADD